MRCAPAKPVRACTLRKWCLVSHVTFKAPLRTSHFSLQSSHSTLHTSHSTLHTWDCNLRTPHFTSHWTLKTPHFTLHTSHFSLLTAFCTLHTSHFTVHTSHFSLLSSHSTLHTPHFTLHSSRPTLHTALFTLHTSSHLSSSHLIPSHLFSSHLFSYVIEAFMNHFPVLLLGDLHAPCTSQARTCVLCAKLLQCCCPRTWPARDPGAMQREANTFSHFTLHSSHFTLVLRTRHSISSQIMWALLTSSQLFSSHPISSHMSSTVSKFFSTVSISSVHWSTFLISLKFVSTHLSDSARQKALTAREKSLAQKNHWAQKIFAHRHLRHKCIYIQKPFRNTLHYKACTKHFPVLLWTTKLAQSTKMGQIAPSTPFLI